MPMRKRTITVEQSRFKVRDRDGNRKKRPESNYEYVVTRLQGCTDPPIGEHLTKEQVDELCIKEGVTVNIKASSLGRS